MEKQNLKGLFDEVHASNNGSRAYTVAEALAPRVGTGAPTDNAIFIGQVYVDTDAGDKYFSIATGTGASDWSKLNDLP